MSTYGRRRFVHDAAVVTVAWCSALRAGEPAERTGPSHKQDRQERSVFQPLREGDRVEMAERPERVVERAHQLGHDLEHEHGGCARCTVAALQQAIPFVPEDADLFRAASCLDGGATPHGLQNCGAFTGAGMVIGYVCGTEQFKRPRLAREIIRALYKHFEAEYGTVLCKDVKDKAASDCPKVVARAAQWTTEALLAQFVGPEKDQEDS